MCISEASAYERFHCANAIALRNDGIVLLAQRLKGRLRKLSIPVIASFRMRRPCPNVQVSATGTFLSFRDELGLQKTSAGAEAARGERSPEKKPAAQRGACRRACSVSRADARDTGAARRLQATGSDCKLEKARSRLYRSRFLQPNTNFSAFFEIYKICNPSHHSDLKISAQSIQTFSYFH